MRNLRLIVSEFGLDGITYGQLKQLYSYCTKDVTNFMLIDLNQSKFRKNFDEVLNVN